jgi:hypothetical protein
MGDIMVNERTTGTIIQADTTQLRIDFVVGTSAAKVTGNSML